jgi:hypothetical protein
MMMAVSRRAVKSVPAQVESRGPQVGIRQDRRLGITRGRCPDAGRGVLVGLTLALQPAADVPDAGEPSSGRAGRVALADLDQPASDVLAIQLGRPHFGMLLREPVGWLMSTTVGTWSAVLQAPGGTTGTSALVSRSASWAALVTAWSR